MPITFNSVLRNSGIDPASVRLLRHQDSRSLQDRKPYQLWRDDREAFELYQSLQNLKNHSRLSPAQYWASFIAMPNGDTLFVGLYAVGGYALLEHEIIDPSTGTASPAGERHVYALHLHEALTDLIGRLVIDWGDATRVWIQYAETQDKIVYELRRKFIEDAFPGFNRFIKPLSELESMPVSWREALRSVSGVYLLTCPRTKELYVGKASGTDGFLGRWMIYAQNNHGGNVALMGRDPSDFQVSILEIAGTYATEHEIGEMENRWKLRLQSRELGLNRN
jgi:hypothetical protein